MQDNRPSVYLEGDCVIYRASALGHCLRSLWAARSNMDRLPIPAVVQQGMDEGTNLEPIILELLFTKHNFTFADGSQSVVELNLGAWNGKTLIVRGKLDEIGTVSDGGPNQAQHHLPVDVKAFTNEQVEKYHSGGLAVVPNYDWQQSVYALGYGTKQVYMPIFNKGSWEIELFSLVPITPTHTLEEIRNRVLEVEEAFHDNKIPQYCSGDFACQYPYLHDTKTVDTLPDDALSLCRARIVLSDKIKALDAARKKLDSIIRMKIALDTPYECDGYTVSMFKNPDRFNTDAAKSLLTEAGIDWKNDSDYIIYGSGTQVRFTPPKKAPADES